jgi:phosphopentomutase
VTLIFDTLYRFCRLAREEVCTGPHAVGRVIARPFVGEPGSYRRVSSERKDFSRLPHARTVQEALQSHGVHTAYVGKIGDLFGYAGFDEGFKTSSNDAGIEATLRLMRSYGPSETPAFIWTNLVDFDQEFGHRNDPDGFARALEAFDRAVPDLLDALPPEGRLLLTADHGNDPTTPGTDHSREYVPVLYYDGSPGRDLGLRPSFNDHAATVAAYFGVPFAAEGMASFA